MKKKIYIPLLFSLCLLCCAQGHAQQAARPSADAELKRIASVLSVPEARASEIAKALAYGQQEIEGILKGKRFGMPGGRARMEQLLAERRSRLSRLVDAVQLAKLLPPVPVAFRDQLMDTRARFGRMAGQNALRTKGNN